MGNKWSQSKSLFTVYHLVLQTHAIVIPQQLGVKLGMNYLETFSACPWSVGNKL